MSDPIISNYRMSLRLLCRIIYGDYIVYMMTIGDRFLTPVEIGASSDLRLCLFLDASFRLIFLGKSSVSTMKLITLLLLQCLLLALARDAIKDDELSMHNVEESLPVSNGVVAHHVRLQIHQHMKC